MTRLISEIEHGLLTLNSESQAPERSSLAPHQSIHLLGIDTRELSGPLYAAIKVSHVEQFDWLARAAEQGRSLVILSTQDTIEFYTTETDRRTVLRPVLEAMSKRVGELPDLSNTRTVEQTGIAVARHLLTCAVECAGNSDGIANGSSNIQDAAALSSASTSLGPTLASLFRAATTVVKRVRHETALNDPNALPTLREVESLAAERIVEEELAIWQCQETELEWATKQLHTMAQRRCGPFASQEPSSEVRLRLSQSMGPSISYIPKAHRSAS